MYMVVAPIPDNLIVALEPYRIQFDPTARLMPGNITVLKSFGFSGTVEELHTHLDEIGEHEAPIKVSLAGWDIYTQRQPLLCLPIIAGHKEFVALRRHLLTGPLSPLANQDSDYRPHIVFGRLSDPNDLEFARKLLKNFEPQFIFRVTHLELWQRKVLGEVWQLEKRFGLKGTVLSVPRASPPVRESDESGR